MKPTAFLLCLLGYCFSGPMAATPANTHLNMLVINGYYQQLPWTLSFNSGVQGAQLTLDDFDITLFFENLDVTRTDVYRQPVFREYLTQKYADIELDAVIADSAPAAQFISQVSAFESLIQVLYTPNHDNLITQPDRLVISNEQSHFVEQTLDIMRLQNPSLERIMVVESGAPDARQVTPIIAAYLQRYPELDVDYVTDFTWAELKARVRELKRNAAIYYGTVFSDNLGQSFTPRDAIAELAEVANVPVYGSYAVYLATGMVAGHLSDPKVAGESAVLAVLDYLRHGQFAGYYPVSQSYIDVAAAQRFGLATSLSVPVLLVNEPERWYQRNDRILLWMLLLFILVSIVSLFWNSRLKRLVDRLHKTNRMLKETKQALSKSNGELKVLSRQDALTGLLNRRAMLPMIDSAVSECQRYGLPSTLMLIDLDDFKQINDQLGHNIGDAVLKSVAFVLQSVSRRTDAIARWGGEEFLILAKGISAEEAYLYLEKVRKLIGDSQTIDHRAITFSAGICEVLPEHTSDSLVAEADQAMYDAKLQGKNQTRIYQTDAERCV